MNAAKVNNSGGTEGGTASIYVVDDEPMLLQLAAVILEPLDLPIRTFRDPESALKAFSAERTPPALIITDYAMHSMTGLDLIEACRRLQPRQKTLLLSGTVDERVLHGAPCQPDRFLAKPYQARQLLDAVRSLLGL